MNTSEPYNIQVRVFCQLSSEQVGAFSKLLWELLSYIEPVTAESLKEVIIVPDGEVAGTVNEIINAAINSPVHYWSGVHEAQAVAVPVEVGSVLLCFIVIGESLVQVIDPAHYHDPDLVSTLLEELLHAWLYTVTWHRRGYVQPQQSPYDPCTADLFTIASRMCDEYIVGCTKGRLMSSVPLVEAGYSNELTVACIRYGDHVSDHLDRAMVNLSQSVIKGARKSLLTPDDWGGLLEHIYRDVLEPLARDTAFRVDTPEEPLTEKDAQMSWFYRECVAEYWHQISPELRRVFDSELSEVDSALDKIVRVLREFLQHIGVTYRKVEEGRCWARFDQAFFDRFL